MQALPVPRLIGVIRILAGRRGGRGAGVAVGPLSVVGHGPASGAVVYDDREDRRARRAGRTWRPIATPTVPTAISTTEQILPQQGVREHPTRLSAVCRDELPPSTPS